MRTCLQSVLGSWAGGRTDRLRKLYETANHTTDLEIHVVFGHIAYGSTHLVSPVTHGEVTIPEFALPPPSINLPDTHWDVFNEGGDTACAIDGCE